MRSRLRAFVLVVAVLALVACGGSSKPPVAMPGFPMPPPPFSASAIVKRGLVLSGTPEKLGDVFDRVREALERGGFTEWSVYSFGDDGFAVVTRMERIQDDGRPSLTRFTVRRPLYRVQGFSLDDYRQLLFNASPGRYRMIALVVTSHPFASDQDRPVLLKHIDTEDLAKGVLPDEMRDRSAPEGRCEALVFEFTRSTDSTQPALLEPYSSVPALGHLAGAGLWKAQELAP